MERVDHHQIVAYRLVAQHLAPRLPLAAAPHAAACGLQDTPPGNAALMAAARVEGLTPALLRHAVADTRELVQLWCLRGSPHLVRSADVALFTTALLPDDEESWRHVMLGFAPVIEQAGYTATDTARRTVEGITAALASGSLTKRELGAALAEHLPDAFAATFPPGAFGDYAPSLARAVGFSGVFCMVPREGNEAGFVRTDRWLGDVPAMGREVARQRLLRRYLRWFGPSTATDFAGWAGIAPHAAEQIWGTADLDLVPVQDDHRTAWLHAADVEALRSAPAPQGTVMVPAYDPYVQARDRITIVPDRSVHRRIWRASANPGVVLHAGEVVALWRQHKKRRRLEVAVEPLTALDDEVRAQVQAEADRYGPFRGCDSVSLGLL